MKNYQVSSFGNTVDNEQNYQYTHTHTIIVMVQKAIHDSLLTAFGAPPRLSSNKLVVDSESSQHQQN